MKPVGFIWDTGNREKNWKKHGVSEKECEEVFANTPLRISDDPKHSSAERRYSALGKTHSGRRLVVFFTIRNTMIRVISARNQSKKERRAYEEATKAN
ncbi:MAG: hypothetical protein UY49_C0002G0014 [Microgenomates group bacterium GW2011_GWC1_49_7]|nr:MAG: hypothetical protein UY49_C0002G0014 [Microgenomates group bacterium GW2011_GWC1_49_7]